MGPRRVNAIRPGYTDSEMWSFLSGEQRDDLRRRVAESMPVRRMGTPEDIAHAAVFLMTNPQVTGTILEVSGGESPVDTLEPAMILVIGATGQEHAHAFTDGAAQTRTRGAKVGQPGEPR